MKYHVYDGNGKHLHSYSKLELANRFHEETVKIGRGGWIEDDNGKIIVGKKPAGTIDLTPTWTAFLPYLLLVFESGDNDAKQFAKNELERMAKIADSASRGGLKRIGS